MRLGDPSGRADGVSFYRAWPAAGGEEARLRGGEERHTSEGGWGAAGRGLFFAVRPDVGRWASLGFGAVSVLGGLVVPSVRLRKAKKKPPPARLRLFFRAVGDVKKVFLWYSLCRGWVISSTLWVPLSGFDGLRVDYYAPLRAQGIMTSGVASAVGREMGSGFWHLGCI